MNGTCEIRWCQREDQPLVRVNENIDDGCYKVDICKGCAEALGIRQDQDLPGPDRVQQLLSAAGRILHAAA